MIEEWVADAAGVFGEAVEPLLLDLGKLVPGLFHAVADRIRFR